MWGLLFKFFAYLFAAGAIVYVVQGIIGELELQQGMRDSEMHEAVIDVIDKHARKVKLKDLLSDKYLEVQGDGVSNELHEGQKIYA